MESRGGRFVRCCHISDYPVRMPYVGFWKVSRNSTDWVECPLLTHSGRLPIDLVAGPAIEQLRTQ